MVANCCPFSHSFVGHIVAHSLVSQPNGASRFPRSSALYWDPGRTRGTPSISRCSGRATRSLAPRSSSCSRCCARCATRRSNAPRSGPPDSSRPRRSGSRKVECSEVGIGTVTHYLDIPPAGKDFSVRHENEGFRSLHFPILDVCRSPNVRLPRRVTATAGPRLSPCGTAKKTSRECAVHTKSCGDAVY